MKNYLLFILALLSSAANPCGYYPYGEDIRFCFFRPEYYGFLTYSPFYYSSNTFEDHSVPESPNGNDGLWYEYCKGKVAMPAIHEAVYGLSEGEITRSSRNPMVKYLFKMNNVEAINYLKFAKRCEVFNEYFTDPWERDEHLKLPQRAKYVKEARMEAMKVRDSKLKLRYNFLAMRMAFYNEDFEAIKEIFDSAFSGERHKDLVYYWSLYFNIFAEANRPLANYYSAQVFANAPDKRFAVYYYFENSLPVAEVLKYAKTEKEKANVYLLKGIVKHDRALHEMKMLYRHDASHEGLAFLLLREVNKIEDWVHTPYYSLYTPSVTSTSDTDWTSATVLKRVVQDRKYAAKVLQFVNSVNLGKVHDPLFWQMAKVQLEFAAQQYGNALRSIETVQAKLNFKSDKFNELQMIKALCVTALQPYGQARIPDAVKPIVMKNKSFQKFVFALGRELEYKGNTSDAALLYSHLTSDYNEGYSNHNSAYWKSVKNDSDIYGDFYDNYFDYLNIIYTPEQVASLIQYIRQSKTEDEFEVWKLSRLKEQVPKLYDLLGTKYIRQDKLQPALNAFGSAGSNYWESSYSPWERNDSYGAVFDANPFYDIKHTPRFIKAKDGMALNKYTVTKQLIEYIKRANDPAEKDRDYYYFLVANCYYNMSHYGNSWMMRRFFWSSSWGGSILEDENEFRECNNAKRFYELAMQHAKTLKFKALCLRMIAMCDTNRQRHKNIDIYPEPRYLSPYYARLKQAYPKYYDDLTTSCTAFADYFNARR